MIFAVRLAALALLTGISHYWLKVEKGSIDLHSAFVFSGALLFFFGESIGKGVAVWPTSENWGAQDPAWSSLGIWKVLGIVFWIVAAVCFFLLGI